MSADELAIEVVDANEGLYGDVSAMIYVSIRGLPSARVYPLCCIPNLAVAAMPLGLRSSLRGCCCD